MRPFANHRPVSRTLKYAAVATAVVIGLATCLGYMLVARHAPSSAQPILWVGLATLLLELAIAGWSIRAVEAIEEDQKGQRLHFLATAIHDLRQPLQAATLFVDSLLHSSLSPQPLKVAQRLDQSIQSVRLILDNLLDISSLDAGAVFVQKKTFNLIVLLHALEAEFTPQAISKNLRFCFYCPSTDIFVNSDPKLVQMILRKLLINAIAETRQGGILLGVRQRGSQVLIQVWDTHTNMQKDPSNTLDPSLAIANRVAALIQSPLIFELKTGRGSVCTLTLSRGNTPAISPSSGVQIQCLK